MNWLARFSIRSSLIQPCLRLLLILFILLMGGAAGGVLAQGNILTYGTTVVGTLAVVSGLPLCCAILGPVRRFGTCMPASPSICRGAA